MHARRELIAAVVLIALGIGYGWLTAGLPERAMPNTPGPRFFPWIVTVSLLALAVTLLVRALRRSSSQTEGEPGIVSGRGHGRGRGAVALGAFVVYTLALPAAGFLAATIPFFAVLMALFGERRWWLLGIGAVAVPVLVFVLFRHGFQIILPAGRIGLP